MTHEELRDLLPDLLHGRLEGVRLSVLDGHLAECAECREELAALELVRNVPSFEPLIDAARIGSVIPPYASPLVTRPSPIRRPAFQLLLVAAAVVVVVGSVLLNRIAAVAPVSNAAQRPVAATPSQTNAGVPTRSVVPTRRSRIRSATESLATTPTVSRPRELQVAAGLQDLSDNGVRQLLRELDSFDGLPSSEPDPIGLSDSSSGGAR